MFTRACFVFVWLCCVSTFVLADQITLKNGDRLTGTITTADSTSLNLKTDYAGELTIKWDAIQSISSDQPPQPSFACDSSPQIISRYFTVLLQSRSHPTDERTRRKQTLPP